MPTGAEVLLDALLLEELLCFELLVLLLLLWVWVCPLWDEPGPLSDVVPVAHAPTVKQSEKIPVERR
jgi:hypothetical protein